MAWQAAHALLADDDIGREVLAGRLVATLTMGKYLSAMQLVAQDDHQFRIVLVPGSQQADGVVHGRVEGLVVGPVADLTSLAVVPCSRPFSASSRRFCSQPLFTSCSSGLATRLVVAAMLVPLKPIMMRSSAWRRRMA